VALDRVQLKSQPPLTLERIEVRPVWAGLLQGRLEVATLIVRNAVVPEQALDAIVAAVRKKRGEAPASGPEGRQAAAAIAFLPRHTILDQVTWVPARGAPLTLDARVQLDPDGLPGSANLDVVKGRLEGTKATLQREADHWNLQVAVGGGTVAGRVSLKPGAKGSVLLGQFDAANVEVAALTAPSRTLTGRLEAHTTLNIDLAQPGGIADALQTQTRFTVRNAIVHGVDLARAVTSVGLSRGGETRLDTLAGNVASQGRTVHLTSLAATSGALSAKGNITMTPDKHLSGRVTVDLVSGAAGGAVGVPLVVGGTLDSPSVTLSRGALIGAAIGTAVAPGVGTGAGAKLGDKLEEGLKGLFGK
jgi:hypothetical protein